MCLRGQSHVITMAMHRLAPDGGLTLYMCETASHATGVGGGTLEVGGKHCCTACMA